MKNKRLVVLISILSFLVVVVVMCSALFSVQKIELNWQTTTIKLAEVSDEEILASGKFRKGQSIFLVGKKAYASKIQDKYPYIKINSIETVFPNKLVVHVEERDTVFAIKLSDKEYAFIDEESHVLEIKESSIAGSRFDPCVVTVDGISLLSEGFVAGRRADSDVSDMLEDFMYYLNSVGCSIQDSYDVLKTIHIDAKSKTNMIITTNYGLTIELRDVTKSFEEKVVDGMSAYVAYKQQGKIGTIIVSSLENGNLALAFQSQ